MRRALLAPVFVLILALAALASPATAQMYCIPPVLGGVAIAEETTGFSVNVKYPVLCSAEASRAIRDHVTDFLSKFKLQFPEHDLKDYPHKHQIMTDYSIWTAADGRFASVKLDVMVFTGGAHPNSWPDTMVFDLTDGHRIGLDEVFTDPRRALAELAPVVRDALALTLGSMLQPDMLVSGTFPEPLNYEDFILNDEGIAFFFAPYQVAPYAAGEQVVTIPWSHLAPLLKPQFASMIRP